MAEIFQFKPKEALAAAANLEAFITKCRDDLTVFGSSLDWDAAIWPKVTVFAKLGVTTRRPSLEQEMDAAFAEFAKAYFRYQQGHKPTGTKNESKALRAVEAALLQATGSADISNLSIVVLDEAAKLARQHYSAGAAYHCGREIERLAAFVTDNKLITAGVNGWRSPIRRADDKNKTGKEGKADREGKLPNEIALNALAEIFANNPSNERDIFTTSTFAILMSAPSRISEVLALPVDCEVMERDSDGVERYGWRFFSGKGFEGDIKWIPTTMVSVAKEAVRRLSLLSGNARKLAKWIEESPARFYRHPDCPKVTDDEPLTAVQAAQALGLGSQDNQSARNSLIARGLSGAQGDHTLNSLWKHVLSRLPKDFPWFDEDKGIKYSNALFVFNKNQFHGNRGYLPVELHKPTNNFFNNDLSPREALKDYCHRSIFDRYGYKSEAGGRLKLTSHQARHLLNTIAQRGGLSNLEIAKWSGRADVKQNRTYNHMSEYELVGMAESLDPSKELFGPAGEVAKYLPVSTQEFNTLEHAAAHVTEFGYCVHDYTMSPCEKYRDCVNCTEQVCVKGNTENLVRIKTRLERTEHLYRLAKNAVEQGDMGADRWYQYHEKTVVRLRELTAILESPGIEEGAQIKLRGNDFSQLHRVARKKSIEAVEKRSDEAAMLEDLTDMLGGGFG
ncbi:MAG: integrase [Candidatus Thiodiazotropha sp. (ex Lucinoma borealis)]|nr:integrase [Candidatus Thiodiazotropha sp. (ex Lucinoma borealis)]